MLTLSKWVKSYFPRRKAHLDILMKTGPETYTMDIRPWYDGKDWNWIRKKSFVFGIENAYIWRHTSTISFVRLDFDYSNTASLVLKYLDIKIDPF